MLHLKRLELEGFGPFADPQVLEFPNKPGTIVIYGENMRGKTSLLNAIRYALYGKVLGRGSRERRLHTISNRERAAKGRYGFHVTLEFEHDGHSYELLRRCRPRVAAPRNDADYEQTLQLKRGVSLLGPEERDKALQLILPAEVSRFFLFDGELLQEYEELLIDDSDAGHKISAAIERILGVPILKRGLVHLRLLADEADKEAAREASQHKATQSIGVALQQATEQKKAHQDDLRRLRSSLNDLTAKRAEVEQRLQSIQKHAALVAERDAAEARLADAAKEEKSTRTELQHTMSQAWRSLLREPLRAARQAAQSESEQELERFILSLRGRAVDTGHCETCNQDLPPNVRSRLKKSLAAKGHPHGNGRANNPTHANPAEDPRTRLAAAMARIGTLNKFSETDNAGEVRHLWQRIGELRLERVSLQDRLGDLENDLSTANADDIRRTQISYRGIVEKITIARTGIEAAEQTIAEKIANIERLKAALATSGGSNLKATQRRAAILQDSADVFAAAIERYKANLRARVEKTASKLFRSMTTEKDDYTGLTINSNYGLTIRHRDGGAEHHRSAGAEHVVALALMGALQKNAPLRGPIVMDSPFGRLDGGHTSNVIQTLPDVAEQVVLLVYKSEVDKTRMRELLGSALVREYELHRVDSRQTRIRLAK